MNAKRRGRLPDFVSFPLELETISTPAPVGLFVLDRECRFVQVNQLLAEMNGFSVEEHLGRTVQEILPSLADLFVALFQEVITTGEARLNVEVNGETPAQPGVVRTWNEHWLPIQDETGAVIGINIVAEEITERKRLAEALKQSEERLSVAFETANDAMVMSDAAGVVMAANDAYFQLYGYSSDDVIGHSFAVVFPEEARKQAVKQYRQVFTGQLDRLGYEATVRRKDGTERIVEARTGFVTQHGQRTAMLSVIRDITEHKRAEKCQALLQKMTAALSAALTPKEVITIVLEQGLEALGAAAGTVFMLSEEATKLELFATKGYGDDLTKVWQHIPLKAPVPLAECARTGKPVWVQSEDEMETRFPFLKDKPRTANRSWAALPLIVKKRVIGAFGLSFPLPQTFGEEEQAFMQTIAQQCAQAFERARLSEQASEAATLAERQRLARELHDVVSQTLSGATMLAESAGNLWHQNPERALAIFDQVVKLNHNAQAELRTLLWELRPEAILKSKPCDLLSQLIQIVEGRRGLHAELRCEGENDPLPDAVHIALYRIAQESLNNVFKHSQATQVQVHFLQIKGGFALRIVDNGRGFDMRQGFAGLGLGTMRERATAVGARLAITSQPGKGTTTELSWCRRAAAV